MTPFEKDWNKPEEAPPPEPACEGAGLEAECCCPDPLSMTFTLDTGPLEKAISEEAVRKAELDSRRLRRLRISAQQVIGWFTYLGKAKPGDDFYLEFPNQIPEGAKVRWVDAGDGLFRAMWLVLEHESFDPVPDGHIIPELDPNGFTDYRAVHVKVLGN